MRFAHIALGEGPGLTCTTCTPDPASRYFSAPEITHEVARVTSACDEGAAPNLCFVGPEPFMHPALPQVIASAVEAGAARVRLRTDAGALSVGGNAAGVLSAGVTQIEVVILGADAHTHDRLSGRSGLFEAARSGLATYRERANTAGLPIALIALARVCKHNVGQLSAMVAEVAGWGVSSIDVEVAPGVMLAPGAVADAHQAAMMNGVWLRRAGDVGEAIEPWVHVGVGR